MKYRYNILSERKLNGRLGWWYRFWWKYLLGTEITKLAKDKENHP